MRSTSLSALAVSFGLCLTACGGNVVYVDGDGSGGSGSSSSIPNSSSSSPNSTSSVTPDTVTSSQSGPGTGCQKLCNTVPECFDPGACLDQCNQIYVPGCEPQAETLINCVADFIQPGCDLPPDACQFEANQYDQCVNQGCQNSECSGDGFSCSCSGFCNGTDLTMTCKQDANGGATCDCYFNGQYSGSCFSGDLSCDLASSCCFFDQGGAP